MKIKSLIISLIASASIYAQSPIQLFGKVTDKDGKAIDLASVALFNSEDSTIVKSEYTDLDGSYLISNVTTGNFYIQVNMLGYKEYREVLVIDDAKLKINIPAIKLQDDSQILTEVTITGKIPYIERKIDRTVVTPGALINNEGKNALEVLESAPGVTVESGGNIALKGRSGVMIFINDKPSYLSGNDLENYLRSLPAGSIKSIEIMTNPPAKYEAAGNAGVINIILKRNTLKGLFGNTSLGFSKGIYSQTNNSLTLNYNRDKISLLGNLYAGTFQGYQDLDINRIYSNDGGVRTSSFNQNSINEYDGRYINSTLGLDYYLTDKTAFGVSAKYLNQPSDRTVDNSSKVLSASNVLLQTVDADNTTDSEFGNQLYNFYINHKLDTLGSTISFDADFVKYVMDSDQLFLNTTFDKDANLIDDEMLTGATPSSINIYAAKTDYTKPFSNDSRFEAGLKTAFTATDNEAMYAIVEGDVSTPDYNLSNRFLYDEWINAGYINYSTKIGKVSLQAGLRAEVTKLTGEQLGNVENPDTTFTRNYTSLFPTLYTSTPLDSTGSQNLVLSYGRRINRPYFQDLNPFLRPLNRFTFYTGNPNLLPTFAHNLSLSYNYGGVFSTELEYSKTLDGINETLEIVDEVYFSRPGNIANSESLTLSINSNFNVNSWYSINAYAETAYLSYESDLYTERLNSSGTYYFISMTNDFDLGKGWKLDFGGRYRSDIVAAQLLIKGYGLLNTGVQKRILNGKGTISLNVSDIFFTRRNDGVINNLRNTYADYNSTFDSRRVTINFSLRFGKSTSNKQKYQSGGSEDEQRRVRG